MTTVSISIDALLRKTFEAAAIFYLIPALAAPAIVPVQQALLREAEDLSNLENEMSNSEVKRLACLEKVKAQLVNIQNEIIESSLDGSEVLNALSYQKPARHE